MILIPWLLGAATERLLYNSARHLVIGAGIGAVIYLTWRTAQHLPVYSLPSYVATAAAFGGIIAAAGHVKAGAKPTAWFASWSYSLYLLHHSILLLVAWAFSGYYRIPFGICAPIAIPIIFASLTEVHHKRLATLIKRWASQLREPRTESQSSR